MAALTLNLIIGAATGLPGSAHGQEAAPSEYQMKAAFLYNFAKYVDWPVSVLPEHAPLVIGVFGEDPFGGALDEILRNKVISGHPLVARRLTVLREVTNCQVLFISASEKKHWPEIANALRNRSVLTVSENWDQFTQAGGMIYFFMEDRRVCFDINDSAARKANLNISSKLIQLRKKPSV
jgi:hypothetical protein